MEILKGKIDEIKNKTEIEIRYPEKLLKFSAQRFPDMLIVSKRAGSAFHEVDRERIRRNSNKHQPNKLHPQ